MFGVNILKILYLIVITCTISAMDDTSAVKAISPFIFIAISFALFTTPFSLFCSGFFLSAGLGYKSNALNRMFESQATVTFRLLVNIISIILVVSGVLMWLL